MNTVDVLLELVRLEHRFGYTAQHARVWDLFDRCCHAGRYNRPRIK